MCHLCCKACWYLLIYISPALLNIIMFVQLNLFYALFGDSFWMNIFGLTFTCMYFRFSHLYLIHISNYP